MGRVFRMQIRVRYGECDPQGVVFNANHFGYFDVILTEAWREAIGPYGAMLEHWGIPDFFGMLQQLGMVTAPWQTPAEAAQA